MASSSSSLGNHGSTDAKSLASWRRFKGLCCCTLVRRIDQWLRDDTNRLGWIITSSCFVLYLVSVSIIFGFSLLFKEFVDEFDSKVSTTGYVGCIMSATTCLSSPFTAFLLSKISNRAVCVLGILLCAIGAFTSSLVPSIYYLFLTLGIFYGLGTNFLYHSALCLQLEYFPTNSERPVTISSCGISLTWTVTVPLLHYFITSFGWRTGMQMMSAVIMGVGLIACIPLYPLPPTHKQDNEQGGNIAQSGKYDQLESKKRPKDLEQVDRYKSRDLRSSTIESSEQTTGNEMKAFLSKPETWMFFVCILGTQSSWSFYLINIVSFLTSEHSVGLNENKAATIVFMSGIGEIFGKVILIAAAGILQKVPALYVAALGNVLAAIFTIGLLMCTTYAPAAIFVVLASFARTIWHIYPITGGMEELRYPNGVSTVYFIACGIGFIVGAFAVGGVYDITGSYDVPMVLNAAIFAISGLSFTCVPLIRYIRSRKHKKLNGALTSQIVKDLKDCDKCGGLSVKYSETQEILGQCDNHHNCPKKIVAEDTRMLVESRMSTV